MDYKYTHKNVKIGGRSYQAHFPEEHTKIKGIVLDCKNLNEHDSYANSPNWYLKVFVKSKEGRRWERVYDGSPNGFPKYSNGLNAIVFNLEDEEFKREVLAKERVRDLRKAIRDSERELKEASADLRRTKKGK